MAFTVVLPGVALQTRSACGHDHLVEFYETEAFLVDTVCTFLGSALGDGDAGIVVATPLHRHTFAEAFTQAGIDLDAAMSEGRYLAFDAAALLSRFMHDGTPDSSRFRETIGVVLGRASQGGRKVRVYGEMVALLWGDGDRASALALEDLWNDLAGIRDFGLLCAYPMQAFADEADAGAFKRICEQHVAVIPSEGFSLAVDPAEQSRAVAQLQQQSAALRCTVGRLREQDRVSDPYEHGDQRDKVSDSRDQVGDQRDQAGDQRDQAGDQRDQAGDQRDQAGDQRDHAGDQRDHAADERDQAAELRDRAAERRDQVAERLEASGHLMATADSLSRSARARRAGALDRMLASQDRRAGASERAQAEFDRGTALADRGAGASERTQAEGDRDTALSDRGAGAGERSQAGFDRHTALADRGASAREREERLVAAEKMATARDAAMESSRLKSEFLATMSHEIRTPMNGVIGLTSLLLDTVLDNQQRQYVEGVHGAGEALMAIINDILDFSKIEANRIELELTDFDIAQVIDEVVGLVAEAAKAKGLEVAVCCDPQVPAWLRGDPGRLRQVILNLAANAVKFTAKGSVVLRAGLVSEPDGGVVIRVAVTDTGIGIADEDRHRVFEPFRQADASTTRRFGGTGLGLAISTRLVAAMGGEMGFDSEPGRGSTFWCQIPMSRGNAIGTPALPAASEPPARPPGAPARVLVVDDGSVNQLVAVAMLRKLGYRADVAGNGLEALDALERADYAAIFMDCQMPEMDGYEATAAIRSRPGAASRTPVIAMTAGAMTGAREKCLAAGMDDYLAKPITTESVDAVLARWIGAR